MSSPFSITVFSTTGDPQGIRHVDKSNWSGFAVVFNRTQFSQLKQEPGFNQAGVYLLVGNAAEETIYIGEGDTVGERLRNHVTNKADWTWGVYFFDKNHKIGKTEVQFLEAELVRLAKVADRAILLNKNTPAEPSMAPVARATAQAFLADMLLILPMLGITAFMPLTAHEQGGGVAEENIQPVNASMPEQPFDTVVVPAREDGFQQRFIGEHCWFAIRISARHLPKLKYIAAYRVAPIAAVTHIAEIASVEPYGDTGKYLLRFKGPAQTLGPLPRLEDSVVNLQSPRYAQYERILNAKTLDEIWQSP